MKWKNYSRVNWVVLITIAAVSIFVFFLLVISAPTQVHAIPTGALRVALGTYVGDGTDDRNIATVGFQPDLVFIKADGLGSAVWRSSAMAGDNALEFAYAGGLFSDAIQSMIAGGFQIGTHVDVNNPGTTYYWQAFKINGSEDLAVGSYLGDGQASHNITDVGFAPAIVVLGKGNLNYPSRWRVSSNNANDSMSFNANANAAGNINSFLSNGFQIGGNDDVNENGSPYYYFAFRAAPGLITQGTYTGDGTDDRSINGLGFQSRLVWVKSMAAQRAVSKPNDLAGDSTLYFTGSIPANNRIQAITSDGFQIGSDAEVNALGATYYYAGFGINKVWDGGGGDANWSTCANWNEDTCPIASDNIVFDNTSILDSTLDVGFVGTVGSLSIFFGYTGTITANRSLTVTNDWFQAGGTFDITGQTINLAGNFTNNGTFTSTGSTLNLNGNNQTISGTTTFNNLTKNVAVAYTLTFAAGATQTVTGTLNLQGMAGQLLSLRSSIDGTQWRIDPQGTRTIGYLDVKDSNNTNATAISAIGFNVTNSGNNTGWIFDGGGSSPTSTPTQVAQVANLPQTGGSMLAEIVSTIERLFFSS